VDLGKVNPAIQALVFVVTIHEAGKHQISALSKMPLSDYNQDEKRAGSVRVEAFQKRRL